MAISKNSITNEEYGHTGSKGIENFIDQNLNKSVVVKGLDLLEL